MIATRSRIALLLVLLTVALRLPALLHPRAIDDEKVYSLVANEIVDGGRPYLDAVERKPPLLFWTYATVFYAGGKYNWVALHSVAVLWILATMLGLYSLGRGMFDRAAGVMAALLYCIYQPWGHWKNLAFNGEVMMNLPLIWAWLLALRPNEKWRRLSLFLSGALLCAGFLLKQPAAIAAVPVGFFLLLNRSRNGLPDVFLLASGFVGLLSGAAAVLALQGNLGEAIYWTILDHTVPHVFWMRAVRETLGFVAACFPLLLGCVLAFPFWATKLRERNALIGWIAVSLVGVAAGARFYPHYYIQLVLPLALFAAPWFKEIWLSKLLTRSVVFGWLAGTIVIFAIIHWRGLGAQRAATAAGKYLADNSSPAERIFVWGHAPDIYLDAQRRPACRYILTFPLTGYIFGEEKPELDTRGRILPGAWSNLEADFAKHPPAFIVDAESERVAQFPLRDFPILAHLLEQNYQLVRRENEYVIYRRR